jgi:hypothetical protein
MIAPTASMNPTVATTGPELGLDLGRSISAVGEHIIAAVARLQQPIQFLAVVHRTSYVNTAMSSDLAA